MRVKTILNRVQKQPGFVYGAIRFIQARGAGALEVEVRYRAGGRPTCSGCGLPGPGYDTLPTRQYEFVPLWGLAVFFSYARRRVDCRTCGVRVAELRKEREFGRATRGVTAWASAGGSCG